MFLSDRFVYLELHKTGCTHIRNILKDLLDGELTGSHNQATPDLFTGEKVFLGSVRDPWVWYTSLWAYGCANKGSVFGNVTRPRESIRRLGWRSNPYEAFLKSRVIRSRDPQAWRDTYSNVNDASGFRKWLRMMHDEKCMADIGEGYGACSVSRVAGLMTFRYLKLFCTKSDEQENLKELSSIEQIGDYENDNCFIDYFIRNETLEADLFRSLEDCGLVLPSKIKSEILSRPRSNTSSKKHGLGYYYDIESENLVSERERLIIEKFGYVAPSLQTMA
jgi:hypothetical protein